MVSSRLCGVFSCVCFVRSQPTLYKYQRIRTSPPVLHIENSSISPLATRSSRWSSRSSSKSRLNNTILLTPHSSLYLSSSQNHEYLHHHHSSPLPGNRQMCQRAECRLLYQLREAWRGQILREICCTRKGHPSSAS